MRWIAIFCLLLGCEKERAPSPQPLYLSDREPLPPFVAVEAPTYPWSRPASLHPPITARHFRCRGDILNPPRAIAGDKGTITYIEDCGGKERHSLPIEEGRESVPWLLIYLLNALQESCDAPVTILCGHRCPLHHRYALTNGGESNSKHLIAAEVDFYIERGEAKSGELVDRLLLLYKGLPPCHQAKETLPIPGGWKNGEISCCVKCAQGDSDLIEGKEYVVLSLSYDRKKKKRVSYSWELANRRMHRY